MLIDRPGMCGAQDLSNASEETLCGVDISTKTKGSFKVTVGPVIVPLPAEYRDVPKIFDTARNANAEDPLNHYIRDTPDSKDVSKATHLIRKVINYVQYSKDVHGKVLWTINHGQSYIRIVDPQRKIGPLTKIVDRIVEDLTTQFLSPQQKARQQEFVAKMNDGLKEVLGDNIQSMFVIAGLATDPEYQGRGYASTLVRLASGMAYARGVGTWLISSNTANRFFYGSLGFYIKKTFYIGNDDPTWTEPAVPIDIMVRDPMSPLEKRALESEVMCMV